MTKQKTNLYIVVTPHVIPRKVIGPQTIPSGIPNGAGGAGPGGLR